MGHSGRWENLLYPAIVEDAYVLSDSQQGPQFRLMANSPVGTSPLDSRRASDQALPRDAEVVGEGEALFILRTPILVGRFARPPHPDHFRSDDILGPVLLRA